MTENQAPRAYQIRTFGCQMNVHDSERLAGQLEDAGYVPVSAGCKPDLIVFNTCAVRENADKKLYGTLGHLRPDKVANPGLQIAVGGVSRRRTAGRSSSGRRG
ncbi:tRNA A37 methylthiotransferase MiaB [Amycolatopsis lexingtonensis]|uniref:tRNA A37 methylthiotransferase MiaB n=1 Tax=Amycolatopsis lexingtonensis TaxID=218822 RepID=A0ABR9HQE5_9PSEU|nr:tRNA A37 methylthiotransferase MiaB [Amycolatopsis lexingtonensis]